MRLFLSILITKCTIKLLRIFKLGGTSLPGKVALRLYPNILKKLSQNLNIVMVTGTNGKTTTTRIIEQILIENNQSYITNKSGANLVFGIAATLVDSSSLSGKINASTALLEIDEAAFNKLTDYIQPNLLVVTNFFRDQLDRYGELYTTLNKVASAIQKSPNVVVALNADDSMCASLASSTKNPIFYGFEEGAYKITEEITTSDAMFCIKCKEKYSYNFRVYGHLGGFYCPKCGYRKPETDITCTKVVDLNTSFTDIKFKLSNDNNEYFAKINLPGLYNSYNALAAISMGKLLNLPIENTIKALSTFECGFGRMETIQVGNKTIKVILVKNPTGFNQVLNFLLTETNSIQLAILINDNAADGRDISWLWDVDFEVLSKIESQIVNLYTSGLRADDMSVRLKYAGISTSKISTITNYKELINTGIDKTEENSTFYLLPSYTAMLDLRKELMSIFNLKEFWK